MFKRKKDGGFTLIELMIVIAVIGILAVVLVPKMSGVKDSAKATGVVTNAKSVEAYVVANIDRWNRNGEDATADIIAKFGTDGAVDELTNPIKSADDAIVVDTAEPAAADIIAGSVTVVVPVVPTTGSTKGYLESAGIKITGYGKPNTDKVYSATTIKPN